MSTYVLMKILESTPSRYDKGIRLLTLGRVDKAYDRLISHIVKDQRILDIGCGTGALTLKAANKGANVKGIDINPQMLEIAQKQINKANLTHNIELCEMGIAELSSEDPETYDVIMSGLCFSELTDNELYFGLKEIKRILKQGGLLLIADEVNPKNILKKILYCLMRFPLVIITYILTQTTTHAVKNLPQKIKDVGFSIESLNLNWMENFIEVIAKRVRS